MTLPVCVVPPFALAKFEPGADFSAVNVVKTYIDVALRVVAVSGDDVGPGAGQISYRHLADLRVDVLHAAAITAHVENVEVVEVSLIASIISLAGPELGIGHALEYVARLDEGLTQTDLVVPDSSSEIRITGGVRRVGFNHELCFHPRFVGVVFRVQPVVD